MTVKELKDKLRTAPNNAEVFMLTDKSDENFDVDRDRWIKVHPIEYVTREVVEPEDAFDDFEKERNIILEIETP